MNKRPLKKTILTGPTIGLWQCASCGEQVNRLMPHGTPNRIRLKPDQLVLKNNEIIQQTQANIKTSSLDVCLPCRDRINNLLGSLIMPLGINGDIHTKPGQAETQIIGAITPDHNNNIYQLQLFAIIDLQLQKTESYPISTAIETRLTWPTRQGQIHTLIWQLYEERVYKILKTL